ncbi:MAG: transposase, partial [Reichenbachiella sp.]
MGSAYQIREYHAKYNKHAEGMQFWTHENHAIEMNSNDLWNSRVNYIYQNPVRAGWVAQAEAYLYSSAS